MRGALMKARILAEFSETTSLVTADGQSTKTLFLDQK